MDRREFLKTITTVGAATILNPLDMIPKNSVAINLSPGWNLVSIRVQPSYKNIEPILTPIRWALDSVWTYNAAEQKWLFYSPSDALSQNTLDRIEPGSGYWFKMKDKAVLNIQGDNVSEAIPLKQGWNMIGFNHNSAKPINECISSIKCRSVYTYDPIQGKWLQYNPNNPVFPNNLEFMESGKGYWMDVEEDGFFSVS
jgi:hypothetical protein